jgi:hypothetical protein
MVRKEGFQPGGRESEEMMASFYRTVDPLKIQPAMISVNRIDPVIFSFLSKINHC